MLSKNEEESETLSILRGQISRRTSVPAPEVLFNYLFRQRQAKQNSKRIRQTADRGTGMRKLMLYLSLAIMWQSQCYAEMAFYNFNGVRYWVETTDSPVAKGKYLHALKAGLASGGNLYLTVIRFDGYGTFPNLHLLPGQYEGVAVLSAETHGSWRWNTVDGSKQPKGWNWNSNGR
jgi:hypothetical protein